MATLQAALVAFSLVGAQDTVLVDFHADWCGPCRQMAPTVDQLAAAGYPVRKVNVDQDRELAAQFRVQSIPCFVLLVDGKEVDRQVGGSSYAQLQSMLERNGVMPGGHRPDNRARGQSPDFAPPPAQPGAPLVPVTLPDTPSEAPLSNALASTPAATVPSRSAVGARAATPEQLLAASVRLKVTDPDGNSCGSGTIVDAREGEALVLTCGHIFRDSQGKGEIRVDMFGDNAPQGLAGELIFYVCDNKGDLALVSIRPSAPVMPARIAPADYQPKPGDQVITTGCNGGADATIERGKIASLDKYLGPPNIQVTGQPVEGRSGGGLFSPEGYVIGVCNAADPTDNQGLYAGLKAIQQELDQLQLAYVYNAPAGGDLPVANLAANDPPSPGAAPSVDSEWRPVDPPSMPGRMPAPSRDAPAVADVASADSRSMQPYLPAALLPAAHRPGPAAGIQVIRNASTSGGANSAELSAQERAALAEIDRHAAGAEVICIIRPLADPRAKSEIIVLDKASPAFLDQLADERCVQDARHLTSLSRPRDSKSTSLSSLRTGSRVAR